MTKKAKQRKNVKNRNLVAKDLLTSGLYKRKIHLDRKKADKRKHKE